MFSPLRVSAISGYITIFSPSMSLDIDTLEQYRYARPSRDAIPVFGRPTRLIGRTDDIEPQRQTKGESSAIASSPGPGIWKSRTAYHSRFCSHDCKRSYRERYVVATAQSHAVGHYNLSIYLPRLPNSLGLDMLSDGKLTWYLLASSVASSSGSLVDASGYKFSEKDMKPGKIKLKKSSSTSKTAKGKKPEKGTCSFF